VIQANLGFLNHLKKKFHTSENKIESFQDLLALSPKEFRSLPTVGWKTFRKIQGYLTEYNIIWD